MPKLLFRYGTSESMNLNTSEVHAQGADVSLVLTVASESFERYYSFTFTNTAEYKFSLSDKHLFTVFAGQESIITKNENFSATSKKMVDSRMMLMAA